MSDAAHAMLSGRIVCQFSCGAASAVATKLALAHPDHKDGGAA